MTETAQEQKEITRLAAGGPTPTNLIFTDDWIQQNKWRIAPEDLVERIRNTPELTFTDPVTNQQYTVVDVYMQPDGFSVVVRGAPAHQ